MVPAISTNTYNNEQNISVVTHSAMFVDFLWDAHKFSNTFIMTLSYSDSSNIIFEFS